MNEQLGTISTLLIYGTISAYVVAMVGFAVDLSGFGKGADPGRARKAVGIAMSTSWLGLIFHVGAVVLRAIAAERVPWADMYEFTLMSTMFTMVVFMVVNRHKDVRYLGTLVLLINVVALLIAITLLYTVADGVQPALQSYWLVIHVSVASLATALFCVGAALSVLQLVRGGDERRREAEHAQSGGSRRQPLGGRGVEGRSGAHGARTGSASAGADGTRGATLVAQEAQPTEGEVASMDLGGQEPQTLPARPTFWSRLLDAFPAEETLERLSYRLNAVGLVGWTFVLITGSIWAEYAWGRAWGWDPKEVVSLMVWIIYAAYCHVRLTTGWSKKAFAYFSLAGFAALMFNYYGVNIFINSLHSYAGV
ncbi:MULTISPECIES: c-type cytochrome biogenesis protein CcsB [unclassified Pseudactinotalea]|uniref:c-type cytochrome biogenesis protein CcsB n=1 Tax=Micrococcales TaxID=85006 RepID=UPI003C7C91CC